MSAVDPYYDFATFLRKPPQNDEAAWAAENPYLGADLMTKTPSKGAARLALVSVALALICLAFQVTGGNPSFGIGAAFAFAVLCAIVISQRS